MLLPRETWHKKTDLMKNIELIIAEDWGLKWP